MEIIKDEPNYYVDLVAPGERTHRFRFGGGPLSHPDVQPAVLAAFGFAAACWARLETHINTITMHLNKSQHSSKALNLYEPRYPSTVRDRIKLVRRYFNRHPALAALKVDGDKLCARLLERAVERNSFLHSSIEDFDKNKKAVIMNGIFSKPNHMAIITKREITLLQFGAFAGELNRCNENLSVLSRQLFTSSMIAQLCKP